MSGGLLGVQGGYDADLGNGIVLGLAGDSSWGNITGSTCVETGGCDGDPADSYAKGKIDWLGTLRARAGFATGNMLFYGSGGLAYAYSSATITNVTGFGDDWTANKSTLGWVIGGGGEMKVSKHVSVGAEFLYVDLGTTNYTFSDSVNPSVKVPVNVTDSIARAFWNYRF